MFKIANTGRVIENINEKIFSLINAIKQPDTRRIESITVKTKLNLMGLLNITFLKDLEQSNLSLIINI